MSRYYTCPVIEDAELTTIDIAVWGALCSFAVWQRNDKGIPIQTTADSCFPSYPEIAKFARCCEKSAKNSIKNLKRLGYLTWQKRQHPNNKGFTSNLYCLFSEDTRQINLSLSSGNNSNNDNDGQKMSQGGTRDDPAPGVGYEIPQGRVCDTPGVGYEIPDKRTNIKESIKGPNRTKKNKRLKTAAAEQRRGEAANPALCAGRALPASPEKKESKKSAVESAADLQEAKEKEAEAYIKTKWPNAKLANVKGGTYIDLLRIQENEKMCSECPGIEKCQKNGRILQLEEDTRWGHPVYRIVYGPCPNIEKTKQETSETPQELTIDEAPEAMRITAEYLLLKTGRTSLTEAEILALRTLNAHHYPARVQEEIDKAIERFTRRGEPLSKLTFMYISKALENQMSRNPRKNGFKRAIEHDYGLKFEEYKALNIPQ